jgi:hypothetical protein
MSAFLDMHDEALVMVVLKCCDVTHSLTKSATGSTWTVFGPSCLIMCTNKRLRDCGKKDPAWGEKMAEKRTALLQTLFWLRVEFITRAWAAVQRAAVLGPAARAEQVHVLKKGGQALTIAAEFVVRKRGKSHISLALHLQGDATTGLSGQLGHMHIDLPPAYATASGLRTRQEHNEMRGWTRTRTSAIDKQFVELHKGFVEAGCPIFALW